MNVSEFMTKEVVFLTTEQTVEDAAKLMIEKNVSALPIIDSSGRLIGIITESDFIGRKADIPHAVASIRRLLGQIYYHSDVEEIYLKSKYRPVTEIMTRNPRSIEMDCSLSHAVDIMGQKHFKRLPVTSGGKLVGMITRHDIVRAFMNLKDLGTEAI